MTSHGWVAKPDSHSSNALEFRHSSHKGVELLLPLKRETRDFVLRMADVVVALATIEERSAWEILKDLSVPSGDVFRFRVEAADARWATCLSMRVSNCCAVAVTCFWRPRAARCTLNHFIL